ncbi:MAG: putative solute-binding protein [Myxococcota bacterium]|nr:putative solute-binding protein [Myxococcota bacterium]
MLRTVAMMIALLNFGLLPIAHANAPVERTLCVYDPGGANGDFFNAMKDYRLEALKVGVNFLMKPYTDEQTLFDDFKAGQCKGAVMTATRARPLHPFVGTLEAMGALPEYGQLKTIIKTLARSRAASLMKSGEYESAGVYPGGAIYLFVNDKTLNTVQKLAGKRIATLAFDDAAKTMVGKIGASMISSDVSTFAGKFNNGAVEACYAPAFAYKALELYKGIKDKGGVVRYPLAQMTLQILIRSADFPEGFPAKSRAIVAKTVDKALTMVQKAEASIPAEHLIDIPKADKDKYDEMFLDVRVELRDKQKVYNPKALHLLRKVRCKADSSRAECVQKRE